MIDDVLDSFKPVPVRSQKQPYYVACGTLLEAYGGCPFKATNGHVFKLSPDGCQFFMVLYKDFTKKRTYCLTRFGVGYLTFSAVAVDCTKPPRDV